MTKPESCSRRILNGRVVVRRNTISHVHVAYFSLVGITNVGVVQKVTAARALVGALYERPKVAINLAAVKYAYLLHKRIVVCFEALRSIRSV